MIQAILKGIIALLMNIDNMILTAIKWMLSDDA